MWAAESLRHMTSEMWVGSFVFFLATVLAMEWVAYSAHRWLFHGPLWFLHRSHHSPRKGIFERNDLLSGFFAIPAILLMASPFGYGWAWVTWPIGAGMTVFGVLYFLVHDGLTHRRFVRWESSLPFLQRVRRAHGRHHQDISKVGQEPFGLFRYHASALEEPKHRRRVQRAPDGSVPQQRTPSWSEAQP